MTEAVLLAFNTETRFRAGKHSFLIESIPTESIDLQALNKRLKDIPLFGEFQPIDSERTVDMDNVCLKIEAVYIFDDLLMGTIIPYGPKGQVLQDIIDTGQSVKLTMRAIKEYAKVPMVDRPGYEDVVVKEVTEIIAFDLYLYMQ